MSKVYEIYGKIESVKKIKEGTSNKGGWTLYSVVINGEEFSTFNNKYEKLVGSEGLWKYISESKITKQGVVERKTLLSPDSLSDVRKPVKESDNRLTLTAFKSVVEQEVENLRSDIKDLKEYIYNSVQEIKEMIDLIK
jgi:hypothetical protein